MAKFIGKIILKNIKKDEVIFVVWYLKNAVKGYEKEFEVIHPSYWVVIKGMELYDSGNHKNQKNLYYKGNKSYGLGQMLKIISSLTKKGLEIVYNDLPKKVMSIARKEGILISL